MSNTPIQALHNYHQTAKSLNLAKRIELKELLGITEAVSYTHLTLPTP